MEATHAIILCGGEGRRWNNYLGVKKHFIEIEGEKLLDRTIHLINKYKKGPVDIFVVGNDNCSIEGTKSFVPKNNPYNAGADKYLNSEELWSRHGRTIVFLGDVWFSENCMKSIMDYKEKQWIAFGRKGRSKTTGHQYPEIFAQSFFPQDLELHESCIHKIIKAYHEKKIRRCIGWEHYRCMIGLEPTNKHIVDEKFFNVDDFTDDFDYPLDYKTWKIYREKSQQNTRSKQFVLNILAVQVFLEYISFRIKNKIKKTLKIKEIEMD